MRTGRPPINIWDRIVITETCWLYNGPLNKGGYGKIGSKLAHRVVNEQILGPIPPGICVLHYCDVRNCVNTEHHWRGTRGQNNTDRSRKGRDWQRRITQCPSGHPYNKENTKFVKTKKGTERVCITCQRRHWREFQRKKYGYKPRIQEAR